MKPNPLQPLEHDNNGVLRFKENKIVRHLLDWAMPKGMGMNELARMNFSQDDREQFAQLIGYSLSGFGELSYVRDETYEAAERMGVAGTTETEARIAALQDQLDEVRAAMRNGVARLYGIHPDDLASEKT